MRECYVTLAQACTYRHGRQHSKLGEMHLYKLWHRVKQLSNISPSVSQSAAGIEPNTQRLAVQRTTTTQTDPFSYNNQVKFEHESEQNWKNYEIGLCAYFSYTIKFL